MTGAARLRRGYRRLLRAYPRWYRRERGAEMLTVLVAASPPGRQRPTARDALDLIRGGLRCRLRVPRGPGFRFIAGTVTLCAAVTAAGLPKTIGPLAGPPSEATALAVATLAVPALPAGLPSRVVQCGEGCPDDAGIAQDGVVTYQMLPEDQDYVQITWNPGSARTPALFAQAHERLAAAGWRLAPAAPDGSGSFTASRRMLTATVAAWTAGYFGPILILTVSKSRALITAATIALLGASPLAGWLATAWTLQRYRRHRRSVRAAMAVTSLPVLAASLFMTLGAVNLLAGTTLDSTTSLSTGDFFLIAAIPFLSAPVATTVAGAAAGTVLLALWPDRGAAHGGHAGVAVGPRSAGG